VRVAANVAEEFQRRMDEAVRNKLVQVPKENQATLLILDRSHDLIAPLLHEFTFQAMAYDLLEVEEKTWTDAAPAEEDSEEGAQEAQLAEGEPECYIFNNHFVYQADLGKKKVKKEVLLGDHDEVWKELRHQPIPDVSTWIRNKFAEMRNANPEAAGLEKGDLKGKSLAELRKVSPCILLLWPVSDFVGSQSLPRL
jgi:syntaxin-binding protein 1